MEHCKIMQMLFVEKLCECESRNPPCMKREATEGGLNLRNFSEKGEVQNFPIKMEGRLKTGVGLKKWV